MRNDKAIVPDPNSFVSNSGDCFRTLYESKVQEDGSIVLIPCGKEDIKAEINLCKDQTDIHYIIHQLGLGDTSVLNNRSPMFGDFTEAPKDMREAIQILIDGEREFYQLPLDLRQKFDNDFRKWIVSSGSDEWIKKVNDFFTPADDEREVNNVGSVASE